MDKNIKKNATFEKWKKNFFTFKMYPSRQFNNLILTCFVLFVGIIAYHGYLYYQIKYSDILKSDDTYFSPVPTINNNKLEAVLNKYDQKTKTQSAVPALVPPVIDPSM